MAMAKSKNNSRTYKRRNAEMRLETAKALVNDLISGDFGVVHYDVAKVGTHIISWRFYFDDGAMGDLQRDDTGSYHWVKQRPGKKAKQG
jgi:hypothetical protein